ncbi:hypothetical protein V2K16_08165 [Pseudomonas alliivorans]|uniref:OB-fold protein n=1 Tax=Pseudomonas alliivorans TaxID=2810613 RepID=UPI001AEA9767|nr:hypothetical protein [Pseudomonas alliivorans]MBP0939987.1 hypothetical protein [Pseudomonas alliivorans]MEE4877379.1 hypothetical protein [Pseudomonas alliivorans]MEE4929642.1 hypothetical protein [Pseudomonas alliivorans]MEE4935057.1 hypothetical protein [Pseudomonas alliivorans]MEE4940189.1 hypothetical protein [Pseudomonas alliivorans]
MKALFKMVFTIGGCLMVLGMITNALKSPEEKAADQAAAVQHQVERQQAEAASRQAAIEAEKKAFAEMPTVTAQALASAYDANTVAADARFKGKRFKVSGTVSDINTDFTGDPYVTLRGGVNQFMEPQFGFDKSDSQQLASLRKGSKVTFVCTGRGDVAKTPMSRKCTLL